MLQTYMNVYYFLIQPLLYHHLPCNPWILDNDFDLVQNMQYFER